MEVFYLIGAIILTLLALWFIRRYYVRLIINYRAIFKYENLYTNLLIILGKAVAAFIFIFLINYYLNDHSYIKLYIAIFIFVIFSFNQSIYSRIGFLSRIRYIDSYIQMVIHKKKKQVAKYFNNLEDYEFYKYVTIVKFLLLIILTLLFITNVGLFLLSNIYHILLIASIILFTFALNNLIYFGFVSFLVLQFNQIFDTVNIANIIFIIVSFGFISLGIVIETIFNERIIVVKGSRMVKSLNFSKGYKLVHQDLRYSVYQNLFSKQYYVYYRRIGYVIIFDSYFNAKLSKSVIRKMVHQGKKYLIKNNRNFESWI